MNVAALRRRLRRVIERVGETYSVGATGGGGARPAVFTVLPRGRASTYLPDAAVGGLPRPVLLAYVPHDDPTPVNGALLWRSRALQVRAALDVRVAGETVARLLVAA